MNIPELEKEFKEKFPMISGKDCGVWEWVEKNILKYGIDKYNSGYSHGRQVKDIQSRYYIRVLVTGGHSQYFIMIYCPNGRYFNIDKYWDRKIDAVRMAKRFSKETGLDFRT